MLLLQSSGRIGLDNGGFTASGPRRGTDDFCHTCRGYRTLSRLDPALRTHWCAERWKGYKPPETGEKQWVRGPEVTCEECQACTPPVHIPVTSTVRLRLADATEKQGSQSSWYSSIQLPEQRSDDESWCSYCLLSWAADTSLGMTSCRESNASQAMSSTIGELHSLNESCP
jgi:hypothetical protein